MKIAVIGTGISGLGAAYLLNPHHDVIVYEKNAYIGGHSRTIDVPDGTGTMPVDTGFIVFNRRSYPLLTGLFDHLNVPVAESDMSFGASISNGWLEYGSKALFGQKKNIFRPQFWRMIFDILRFNRLAPRYAEDERNLTLRSCLDELEMGDWFRRYYLQAMGAAIWSCSVETVLEFPAASFIRFFINHGLLSVNRHPQWYTVKGGSREYVSILTRDFADRIKLNCGVQKVTRQDGKITVHDATGTAEDYDRVVFACAADQALKLIDNPDRDETDILGSFRYQENRVVAHNDSSFMPARRKCWASWVYLSEDAADRKPVVSLTYWMNNLQNLETKEPLLVTLNPGRRPAENRILDEHVFAHPVFDAKAVAAQEKIDSIQGRNNSWYCGAYQRYGFHEDGLLSAVKMAAKMGVEKSWK